MRKKEINLTASNEDYLEAILMLEKQGKVIKSVKIAEMLNVSQPGVNKAMNILKKNGLINKDAYSDITLTDLGRKFAEEIYERHLLIFKFLRKIGVSKETAEEDCCKIEHVLSDETVNRIRVFCNEKK